MSHPCLNCGACCASFRVSFYWAETDAHPGGSVPVALTVPVTPHRVAMLGTQAQPVRCVALQGSVGRDAACGIYARRSSTCREFSFGDERCHDARRRHGLAGLTAQELAWTDEEDNGNRPEKPPAAAATDHRGGA